MLKKLKEKRYVDNKKYGKISLTKKGKEVAINVLRKHRLWETFLYEKLDFNWAEVHDVAEQLEHIKSPKLIDELDAFLEYPKQDPHGDPIPDKHGNLHPIKKRLLSSMSEGEKGICIGVKDSSAAFLQFLDKQKIALGKEVKVLSKEVFDDSLTIAINKKELSISNKIANNLYIQIQ